MLVVLAVRIPEAPTFIKSDAFGELSLMWKPLRIAGILKYALTKKE